MHFTSVFKLLALNLAIFYSGHAQQTVQPPSGGLGSNSNYFFASNGAALQQVQATITFEEAFITISNGVSIQLNCYSSPGHSNTVQQFVISIDPSTMAVNGAVDTWMDSNEILLTSQVLMSLSEFTDSTTNSPTIPAGTSFIINLANGNNNEIRAATFTVSISGHIFEKTIAFDQIPSNDGSAPQLAPIAAITLNIVGFDNGEKGVFKGGSGAFAYEAATAITPLSSLPEGLSPGSTVETGNVGYGSMSDNSGTQLVQSWMVEP